MFLKLSMVAPPGEVKQASPPFDCVDLKLEQTATFTWHLRLITDLDEIPGGYIYKTFVILTLFYLDY